jgi:hypothetical protein
MCQRADSIRSSLCLALLQDKRLEQVARESKIQTRQKVPAAVRTLLFMHMIFAGPTAKVVPWPLLQPAGGRLFPIPMPLVRPCIS